MTQPTQNDRSLSQLICLGVLRSSAGFVFEHPLGLIKLKSQAYPEKSSKEVIQTIVRKRGLFGFSETMMVNFPRHVIKEAIRWPVIAYTHEKLIEKFPSIFVRENVNTKIATGALVALFDTLIILPFDRLIAFRIIEQKNYSLFFKKIFTKEGLPSLYRGVFVNIIRQGTMWTTLMAANHESKRLFDLVDKERLHPFLRQGTASVLIGTSFVALGLPIDFVKTRIQMDPELQKKKTSFVVKTLFQKYGFSGFYAGWLPVFIHTTLHVTLGGYILDKIFDNKK